MAYFLAIDAGGTKTDYLLADNSRMLARARSGTIKRMRADAFTALRNLEQGLLRLQEASGVAPEAITQTCVGTAGNTVALVTDFLRHELGARVGGGLLLLGDVEIALDAAFPGEHGVLILAGTGSNVAGRGEDGVVFTAGGWGPALSDQGSGYRIGCQALRAVAMAHDEGTETALLEAVLTHWQLRSFHDLVDHANSLPAPDFSTLTEVVLTCAQAGDELAMSVLRSQGEELAEVVRVLLRKLHAAPGASDLVPRLAFAGSIMERVRPVRDALVEAVQTEFPFARALPGVVDPAQGALWRARDAYRRMTAVSR